MHWGSLLGKAHLENTAATCSLTFSHSQASFVASGNRTDISLDDPNFWQKWAKIAELDTDAKNEKVRSSSWPQLVQNCPTFT